jgi:methyltransferase (TIGR00027 family)
LVRLLRWIIPPLGQVVRELVVAHCVRHRAIDELLLAAVRQEGFTQVVVLGAGYDMRPSRFAAASGEPGGTIPEEGSLRWIEIDDAWTQARKRRRLAGQAGVRAVVHESCDLAAEPLAAPLARAGFDPTRPTCFVLEGLIHYLAAATIASLLDTIATSSAAPVRVIFSCIAAPMRRSATPVVTSLFRIMGEIPRSFLDPAGAAALLGEHGFTAVSSWSFKDQIERLLPAGLPERRSLHARWWQTVVQADRKR